MLLCILSGNFDSLIFMGIIFSISVYLSITLFCCIFLSNNKSQLQCDTGLHIDWASLFILLLHFWDKNFMNLHFARVNLVDLVWFGDDCMTFSKIQITTQKRLLLCKNVVYVDQKSIITLLGGFFNTMNPLYHWQCLNFKWSCTYILDCCLCIFQRKW